MDHRKVGTKTDLDHVNSDDQSNNPGYTAEVAVAFNPTEMMQGANFIIGYVQDGRGYIRDDYGSRLTSHVSDESQGGTHDVVLVMGEEKNGGTTLRFTLPVNSSDEYDGKLNIGGTNTILLAYGGNDSFTSVHRVKTKVETEF